VNKFTYGIRLPVVDKKIIELGRPKRGDVVVFRFPEDPSIPFIKRVVGLPGDRVGYYNKQLYINGVLMPQEALGVYTGIGSGQSMTGADIRREDLDGVNHLILIEPGHPSLEGESVIPPGHYFVMGDNRDNSRDSRFWGTVPDENLIGKAFFIWMSWDWAGAGINWNRIGDEIQ
jgi:signal peptidase I